MHTIAIQEKDIPVIKSSLQLKRNSLEFNIKRYRQQLDKFEEQFNMTSKEFLKQFKTENLGDQAQWFEWEYFLEVYEDSLKQVNQINEIKL